MKLGMGMVCFTKVKDSEGVGFGKGREDTRDPVHDGREVLRVESRHLSQEDKPHVETNMLQTIISPNKIIFGEKEYGGRETICGMGGR